MNQTFYIEPREVRDLKDPFHNLAMELFYDSTTAEKFVANVKALKELGFDFNGLHSRQYTIGRVGLMKGDISVVYALDEAGYNFAIDPEALDFAERAWHGSLYPAVARSAHKHDPSIEIPTIEGEAAAEAAEMETPSMRGLSVQFRIDNG